MLVDSFGRTLDYLRISVTDRCNIGCVYCAPPAPLPALPIANLLSYDHIARFVSVAASLGIRYLRLTGGEPLMRPNVHELVSRLARVPGIEEVALTTNGLLLARQAERLAAAGLKRVNVSLDTLDQAKYRAITRGGVLDRVWSGLAAAEAAGLLPIKLNTVVVGGVNDDELLEIARLTMDHPWHVRLIECMPFVDDEVWDGLFGPGPQRYVSIQTMMERLLPAGLQPADKPWGHCPVVTYRLPSAKGTVSFIAPLGNKFCQDCSRLRLTADGYIRTCLLIDSEVSVRQALQSDGDIAALLVQAASLKPESHRLEEGIVPHIRAMRQIGG